MNRSGNSRAFEFDTLDMYTLIAALEDYQKSLEDHFNPLDGVACEELLKLFKSTMPCTMCGKL